MGARPAPPGGGAPPGWAELRSDGDLQFAPVALPDVPPPQPTAFEQALRALIEWLADLLAPLGEALGAAWWWLQWVVLGALALFVLVLLVRVIGPALRARRARGAAPEEEWRPDEAASLALLEDADRLAREGRFDEATHLLLQRSIGQIAAARPEWVAPSSTARELAALAALPETARAAFGVIAERVERSLFALRALGREDWEAARAAYARFALARLESAGEAAR
ncbi:hypothetical protein [Erythrobacter cryptus]|uniref:hypothetical protein n=1 Tax=Erythrobacter cryptus TaxID=196588 RepID=UPI000413CE3F|nr:hypothetical protein [Erythrobacter cryptus]